MHFRSVRSDQIISLITLLIIGPIPTMNKLFSIHTREWERRGHPGLEQVIVWPDYWISNSAEVTSEHVVHAFSPSNSFHKVHQCFCRVPYIILISAGSTLPALFIPLCSPLINLITLPNIKDNIKSFISIILSENLHDCHILLFAVDRSCNIWIGFC